MGPTAKFSDKVSRETFAQPKKKGFFGQYWSSEPQLTRLKLDLKDPVSLELKIDKLNLTST